MLPGDESRECNARPLERLERNERIDRKTQLLEQLDPEREVRPRQNISFGFGVKIPTGDEGVTDIVTKYLWPTPARIGASTGCCHVWGDEPERQRLAVVLQEHQRALGHLARRA